MRTLLSFIILLLSLNTQAQNWQCLQSGVKHYFIHNGQGYLRGIRIDSVRTVGSNTVYYPYHTPRGFYLANPHLDSSKGSWLGGAVVQHGGTFVFDDIWNDSVIINTQANVGDTWTFYHDTTALYYRADCISKDTMTVLGVLDSVKTIMITARNSSGIVTSDPVDSFQMILSKNHGFVQVFDLYTFPYHKPDSVNSPGIDFYLDELTGLGGYIRSASVFKLFDLYNPSYEQINVWSAGDVFEHKAFDNHLPCVLEFPQAYQFYFDSVTTVTTYPSYVQYDCKGWLATQDCYNSTPTYAIYDTISTRYTYFFHNNHFVIDTSRMPEEYMQPYVESYFPHDTTYCITGPMWQLSGKRLLGDMYPTFWETYGPEIIYKTDLGMVSDYMESPPGLVARDSALIYYRRSGTPCGTYYFPPLTTAVKEVSAPSDEFSLYPNPATGELNIKTSSSRSYSVSLTNMLGQSLRVYNSCRQETMVSVADLPTGLYNVCIRTENGEVLNRKITVVH